jgi:hypothetical protein
MNGQANIISPAIETSTSVVVERAPTRRTEFFAGVAVVVFVAVLT